MRVDTARAMRLGLGVDNRNRVRKPVKHAQRPRLAAHQHLPSAVEARIGRRHGAECDDRVRHVAQRRRDEPLSLARGLGVADRAGALPPAVGECDAHHLSRGRRARAVDGPRKRTSSRTASETSEARSVTSASCALPLAGPVGKSTTSNTPDRGAKAECSKRQDAIALRDTFIGALSAPSVGAAETQMNWHASLSSWSSLIDGACSTMRNLTRLETTVEWFVGAGNVHIQR